MASWIIGITSIESQLTIQSPAESCTQELRAHTGIPTLTFMDLFVYFLKGTGIPCPNLFLQAQHHFANFDMDLVDHDFFHSRSFCCAATGSYDLECDGPPLLVSISAIS